MRSRSFTEEKRGGIDHNWKRDEKVLLKKKIRSDEPKGKNAFLGKKEEGDAQTKALRVKSHLRPGGRRVLRSQEGKNDERLFRGRGRMLSKRREEGRPLGEG